MKRRVWAGGLLCILVVAPSAGAAGPLSSLRGADAAAHVHDPVPWNRLWPLYSGGAQALLLPRAAQPGQLSPLQPPHGDDSLGNSPAMLSPAAPTNVSISNPAEDGASSQSTQSETSVARFGNTVVVGFNDSLLYNPTTGVGPAGGYAYSTDGGATFTDAGSMPVPRGGAGGVDPGLVADRAGAFYASELVRNNSLRVYIGVAKSTDGGKTFGIPVAASPKVLPGRNGTPLQDKGYIAVGPDPGHPSSDILYVTWTNFASPTLAKIQAAHSTDGGTTWSAPVTLDSSSVGVQGSNPAVDPRTGKLYVFWEQYVTLTSGGNIMMATSTDGGSTYSTPTRVGAAPVSSQITQYCGRPAFHFGTGRDVRNGEWPSAVVDPGTGNVYVTWNEGRHTSGGYVSQIIAAASDDGGATWHVTLVNGVKTLQRFQPWISVSSAGVHVSYYKQITTGDRLTYAVSASPATVPLAFGSPAVLGSATFAVDQTNPNFDAAFPQCYMGDYTNAADLGNGTTFYAWGDNRRITGTGPNPDIFGAAQ